jgi:hypothetical protein
MRALSLTTRYRAGAFESDARLLVYDGTSLSGAVISEDVREVLDHRPNTPRIYVMAPFIPYAELTDALTDSAALRRAGAVALGEELAVICVRLNADGRAEVVSRSYSLDDRNAVIEGSEVPLPRELREGWLFDLFDSNRGRVDAPPGVHFGKASDKHSEKFLRTSSVLLSTAACALVAFFALAAASTREPRRIFVDTAPLLSVAFAMQRVAATLGLWPRMPSAKSFSSYGGVDKLPRLSTGDLLIVSASTSGGLARRLVSAGADAATLVTLFFLKSASDSKSPGEVLCDLTYRPERTFGYPLSKNFPADSCELCKQGFVLAELEGDQFLLERRGVKRLRLAKASQTADARASAELLSRRDALRIRLHARDTRRTDIQLDVEALLREDTSVTASLRRLMTRFVPVPPRYIVLVGVSTESFNSLIASTGMAEVCQSAVVVPAEEVASLESIQGGNALVLIGLLDDHAVLRGINAQMRSKVPGGCVAYLSAVTIAESARNREDLRIFLSYGEHGPETFTFRSAIEVMLPWTGDKPSSWSQELALLRRLAEQAALPEPLASRQRWLESTSESAELVFLPGVAGELKLASNFVFLDTTNGLERISQADVYTVVSNLIATERCDRRGLTEPVRRDSPPLSWSQSVYGQVLLCPSNFRDFNDAVLRASLLRAADPSELNYAVDSGCSREMLDVLLADIGSWAQGQGDALPEFVLSLACGRLRLVGRHQEQFLQALNDSAVPDHLKLLSQAARLA